MTGFFACYPWSRKDPVTLGFPLLWCLGMEFAVPRNREQRVERMLNPLMRMIDQNPEGDGGGEQGRRVHCLFLLKSWVGHLKGSQGAGSGPTNPCQQWGCTKACHRMLWMQHTALHGFSGSSVIATQITDTANMIFSWVNIKVWSWNHRASKVIGS